MLRSFRFLYFYFFILLILASTSFATGSWVKQYDNASGLGLNAVFFESSLVGYTVGNGGVILKTSDGGTTWATVSSGTSSNLAAVYSAGNSLYVLTSDSFRRSLDGGITWTAASVSSRETVALTNMWFADQNTGYICGIGYDGLILLVSDSIWKTTDGGLTWQVSRSASTIEDFYILWRLHGSTASNVWVSGYQGLTGAITKWNGTTWTGSLLNDAESIYGTHVENALEAWCVGPFATSTTQTNAYHTTNGGTSWTSMNIGSAADTLRAVWFVDANNGWVAGTSGLAGVIYHTSNGGNTAANWSLENPDTSATIEALHFVDANTGWAVGGSNRSIILKYSTATTTTTTTTGTTTTTLYNNNAAGPGYPAGKQYWNPDRDGALPISFYSATARQATLMLIQIGPPYSSYKRSIAVTAGYNKPSISAASDFGENYANGIYKMFVFDNAGGVIARGLVTIFR